MKQYLLPAISAFFIVALVWIVGSFTWSALHDMVGRGNPIPILSYCRYLVGQGILLTLVVLLAGWGRRQ